MFKYVIKISGVHYGANGDFVAGRKDTKEDHLCTLEMLRWLEEERPAVVLLAYDSYQSPCHIGVSFYVIGFFCGIIFGGMI